LGGADASFLAVEHLPRLFLETIASYDGTEFSELVYHGLLDIAIDALNHLVYNAGDSENDKPRMGTTLTGGLFLATGSVLIFNVGDSRTYRYREQKLERVTTDQSWYQAWLNNGSKGPPPPRNIILQGIGLDDSVTPDWIMDSCQPGDVWLCCSDGLTDLVDDKQIHNLLKRCTEQSTSRAITREVLQGVCKTLVDTANSAGGDDNVTVLALSPEIKTL